MSKIKLTPAQQAAVENRGGALLVSAAAGSGKTKVLVERLFRYVQEERCNIDDFLIITYTKAAAAELRSKIAAELGKRLAENPGDPHLKRQLLRVYQADIKTVDAFCVGVLRENTHLLAEEGEMHSLSPDFRVLDEHETMVLQQKVLNRVLDGFYEHLSQGGTMLADALGAGRDDRGLVNLVLELYSKVQSHADPAGWLAENRGVWARMDAAFDETPYAAELMKGIHRKAAHWGTVLNAAARQMGEDSPIGKSYGEKFHLVAELFAPLFEAGSWTEACEAMENLKFPRLTTPRGFGDDPEAVAMKVIWNRCKEDTKKIGELLAIRAEEAMEDLQAMAPAMEALLELTETFAEEYRQEKLHRNSVDFSDQEHLALKLLVDPEGNQTPLGELVAARYREVLVDEFQDTNEVQNAIFRAVTREGQNLFTVGDVKQSIYRFRLADPTIFLDRYHRYRSHDQAEDGEPRKILLSQNFRSRQEILDAANFVFENILSKEMGSMDYGEDEALHFGAAYYPERHDCETEFHLISAYQKSVEHPNPVKRITAESRFVAQRIAQLLEEKYPVTGEDGTLRPCRPEDIVILMRSPGNRLTAYAEALGERDIPCSFQQSEDFFNTMEISVMLALLEIIDNPRQDVPLISVLRSPLFGFTPDRLAIIRGAAPKGEFYDAVAADEGEDTREFLRVLHGLRSAEGDMSVHRLIWHIYNELNVLGLFGAMDHGAERRENLIALGQHAEKFEQSGYKGLFAFVTQLRRQLEMEQPPATRSAAAASGVQIMSIHKSKGLEFPIVILTDLDHGFSNQDFKTQVLVHPTLGLGPSRIDLERKIKYPTLARKALEEAMKRENMEEEQRILYVAMTRPKEKLILVDAILGAAKRMEKLTAATSCPVQPETVAEGKNLGDWILLPLLCRPEAAPLRALADLQAPMLYTGDTAPWQVICHESEEFRERPEIWKSAGERGEETKPFDPTLLEFTYPYERETQLPAKVTATQLKGRILDQEIAEQAAHTPVIRPLKRPRFRQETHGLTAAERGTATHLVLQYLDFSNRDVASQVETLLQRRLLTPEQAEAVDLKAVARLLDSDLAGEICRSKHVLREYPFTILLDPREYDPAAEAGDTMLLQGVVDCCFETEEGLTVVDFKTDHVWSGEEIAQRAEGYRPQLDAYSRALEAVLEKKVTRKVLYFLTPGKTVEL